MHTLTYLALNGSLGTGFKESSLDLALSRPLDFIAADSGSTDGGPYYLGTGEWIWARSSYERDLRLGLLGAHRAGVPLIIGSCGGGGGDAAVDGYVELVEEIVRAAGFGVRVATVHCEPDRDWLAAKYLAGDLRVLPGAPTIDEQTFAQPGHIVAMAGAEPIQEAIDAGADVVLAGRTSDAALFAAIPLARGYRPWAGLERRQDRRMRVGCCGEPLRAGLPVLHVRRRRLHPGTPRPGAAVHPAQCGRAHPV